jgi:hypothetical protein
MEGLTKQKEAAAGLGQAVTGSQEARPAEEGGSRPVEGSACKERAPAGLYMVVSGGATDERRLGLLGHRSL